MSAAPNADEPTNTSVSPAVIRAPDDRAAIVAHYRMVAEHAPLAIAVTIGDMHELCAANPAFRHLLGPQSPAQLGKPLLDSLPVIDADRLHALLDRVYQTGVAARRVEGHLLQVAHDQRVWAWTIWPICDQQNRSTGLVFLIEDMYTDQRDQHVATDARLINEQLLLSGLREHELAEQIQHQLTVTHTITTSVSEGLYVLDTAGRCTFANPAAERILGWTTTELHGKDMREVLPFALLDMLHLGTTQQSDSAPFVHQNGSVLPTAYSAAPMVVNEQLIGSVVTFRDMTDMHRLQRLRDEYLALISHDLRSPLTVILGRAQLLVQRLTLQGLLQEAQSASIMVDSCFRMNKMIGDLVDRSQSDTEMQAHQRSRVDLVALVQRMIDQTIPPEDRSSITFDAVATLPVVVEVAQIERVVVNLLTNARKFSPREYPIHVQVYQQTSNAIMSITDHGIGITAEDLPHLFEKYYRARTVRQIEGSGLGLYSSRLMVEAHGGQLNATSTVGTGSTFQVILPLPANLEETQRSHE